MSKYSDATLNQDRWRDFEMLKMCQFQKKLKGVSLGCIVETPPYFLEDQNSI
jgi:hypothetical protein